MKATIFYNISFLLQCFCLHSVAQTEGLIQNKNARIYYRTYGKGNPLLIINGGPGLNSEGFVSLAKELSAANQTIIYDQRGTGKSIVSPVDSSTITMQLMIEDMEVLRKHLGFDHWSILGHSFGGMLASYYATVYPEHIRLMILSSSGGIDLGLQLYVDHSINDKLSKAENDSLKYWNDRIAGGDTSYSARYRRGMVMASAYVVNKKNIPIIAERLTQGNPVVTELVWQDLNKIKFNCAPKLKNFIKPVLIIQGRQDIIMIQTAEYAHKVLRNSKIVIVDHCAHYGWLDNPQDYFKEVNLFLLSGLKT
ncbi:MAG TPA: alpha/beta fold hydrolase [Puia sp.]|nr:alpha/beta fold hydrolase [Puia sp.]